MRALIAMSGGVDSSVAAYLTAQQGYTCTGCTMKLYDNDDAGLPAGKTCCSLDDVEDARSVAYRLGMPYYVHAILPQEPISVQSVIDWFTHDELIAIEHFVSTKPAGNNIVLHIVFIKNEIGNKIADEAFKDNRIINN